MLSVGAQVAGLRLERVKGSPRYADGAFRNTHPAAPGLKKGTAIPTISEYLCGGQKRTPPGPLPSQSPLSAWSTPVETGLRATWLGHSTVLLEIDGVRVLTDPVWGERASPSRSPGRSASSPCRCRSPQLPPLDAVVISHDHYDHLDYPTILELAKLDVPFVTSLGVGAHLEAWGVPPERITELDWWESAELRARRDRHRGAVAALLRARRRLAQHDAVVVVRREGAAPRPSSSAATPGSPPSTRRSGAASARSISVMLEVGAYHPAWGDIHLGPEHALEALALLGGGSFLPVHWGTFNLAIHAWDEPAETLLRARARERGAPRDAAPRRGGGAVARGARRAVVARGRRGEEARPTMRRSPSRDRSATRWSGRSTDRAPGRREKMRVIADPDQIRSRRVIRRQDRDQIRRRRLIHRHGGDQIRTGRVIHPYDPRRNRVAAGKSSSPRDQIRTPRVIDCQRRVILSIDLGESIIGSTEEITGSTEEISLRTQIRSPTCDPISETVER